MKQPTFRHSSRSLSSPSCGFTLVELLASVAIIGVLSSFMLPAVQHVRETARRAQCQNNMRQIAIAMQVYDSAEKCLPPAKQVGKPERNGSAFIPLLQYLDEGELIKGYDYKIDPYVGKNADISNRTIPVFICPTMNFPDSNPIGGRSSYGLSTGTGPSRYPLRISDQQPDLTNHNGAIIDRIRGFTSVASIAGQDGTTRTFLLGELDYGLKNLSQMTSGQMVGGMGKWAMAYPGVTWCSVAGVFNSDRLITGFLEMETFRSDHPAGANFVMVDTSVRWIGNGVSAETLKLLAQRNDGQPIEDL